jgi:polysaccharide pyruvyl transferase WcaK-like protein
MKQKKIAILTQPLKTNYGGILQAYALQKVIKSLGHDVITIDRKYNTYPKYRILLSRWKNSILQKVNRLDRVIFSEKELQLVAQNSSEFISNHIKLSEIIDTDKKIITHFKKNIYDSVIVGSDQVWRPRYSPNIYNFFLDFLKGTQTKRIAYAPSFGSDQWEFNSEQTEICKELINQFDAISVREDSGILLCEKYLKVTPKLVLDPSFLLSKQTYIDLIKNKNLNNKKGLFTYVLDRNTEKANIINKVSEKLNLAEFNNQPKESIKNPKSNNVVDYIYPPVEGWLNGFYQADFIVTDSFHGTVFSILFNKPFIAIANEERGIARFKSILKQFNLQHRLVFNATDITPVLLQEKLDYNSINTRLENLKIETLIFLKNAI